MTGKIIKGIAGFYYVDNGTDVYECKAKGVFRNKKIKPLVGDNVEFTVLSEAEREGNIDKILPRKNELVRPAVANIDQALVIFSITHPEPNLNLLDRFLVMMEVQEVPVKICFNKTDLTGDGERDRLGNIYSSAGYPVYFTSTYENSGLDELRVLTEGKTTVLAGPSGVGKSSITNLLFPEAEMETGKISEKIQRGKHTTRHSELIRVGEDTFVMDTPGFSSLFVDMFEEDEIKYYFKEFEPYEGQCRFQGCSHTHEPGCGVKQALDEGKISKTRYDNYVLIYNELKEKRKW